MYIVHMIGKWYNLNYYRGNDKKIKSYYRENDKKSIWYVIKNKRWEVIYGVVSLCHNWHLNVRFDHTNHGKN